MFERFTDKARALVNRAQFEARSRNHASIGTEHILLALVNSLDNNVGYRVLTAMDVDLAAVREEIDARVPPVEKSRKKQTSFTKRAKTVLELSLREALKLGHNYIGTEHLLLGMLCEREGVAAKTLAKFGVTYELATQAIVVILTMPAAAGGEDRPVRWQRDPIVAEVDDPVVPPACPNCRGSLLDTIAYKIVEAAQDGGPGHRKVCFVYCEGCGHTLLSRFEPEE